MLLRDGEGNHYEAPRRASDPTTRLRRLGARAEHDTGVIVIVVATRLAVKIGPVPLRLRGWEIVVSDSAQTPSSAGTVRTCRYREAAALIRGVSMGAFAVGGSRS